MYLSLDTLGLQKSSYSDSAGSSAAARGYGWNELGSSSHSGGGGGAVGGSAGGGSGGGGGHTVATAQHSASEPPRLLVSFPIYIYIYISKRNHFADQLWDVSLNPQFPSMELPHSVGDAICEAIRFGV